VKQTLKWTDTLGLGLMVFSFFFGAGNLIFPPLAGQLAGWHVGWTLAGFVLSSVLLPLVSIIAIARGGTLADLLRELPKGIAVTAVLVSFSLMGPLFVTPRTGLVVYDMVFKPLLLEAWPGVQYGITGLFFTLTLLFCWSRGRLIDYIGKLVTPVLLLLLIALAVGVLLMPQGAVQSPQAAYLTHPLAAGFIDGYQTMDNFGSLMFGALIIKVLRNKGITDPRRSCHYLVISGLIATVGLALVYVSLFWLGATSVTVAPHPETGVQILTAYVQALFGHWGQGLLGVVVVLACLTTAVGLLSSWADYLTSVTSRSYRFWIVLGSILSALIANLDLTTLIKLSQPLLVALYPPAILLVMLTLIREKLPNPILSYPLVLSVALIAGLLDAIRLMGVEFRVLQCIPGFQQGLGWLVPSLLCLAIVNLIPATQSNAPPASDNAQR
jgi:branched-chain amino acid:cation transporter, LIVCS family